MLRKILLMKTVPSNRDLGLLVLRLAGVTPLFLKHGIEKLFGFSTMMTHFPNPLHIGAVPSLAFATLSDGICSLLLIVGLATRWAALIPFLNIFAAWALVHHFQFFGHGSDHGELIVLYLAIMVTLFLSGGGKYSIDGFLSRQEVPSRSSHPVVSKV